MEPATESHPRPLVEGFDVFAFGDLSRRSHDSDHTVTLPHPRVSTGAKSGGHVDSDELGELRVANRKYFITIGLGPFDPDQSGGTCLA